MFHILLSVKAARWENSRAQFRGRGWKFDKFQFPTNSLGQGSSTYFASDKFSISTPLLYAKRPVPSLVPLSLPLLPSLCLSLSFYRLFWPVYGTFSFVLHTCPDTRVHTFVNAETLFCISNVAYITFADDRQDADLPRKSELYTK